jgi:hypothetical protein
LEVVDVVGEDNKGLDDQYSPFCSHIMLKDPLSNIYKVYFLLVQQESQVVLPLDESKFFVVRRNYSHGRGNNSNRGRGSRGGESTVE